MAEALFVAIESMATGPLDSGELKKHFSESSQTGNWFTLELQLAMELQIGQQLDQLKLDR